MYKFLCAHRGGAYVFISLGYRLRIRIIGSYSNVVFTVFQGGFTILQSHQQWMRIAVSPCPCQYLSLFVCFNYSHPCNEYEVVFYCGFDLHFPIG